MLPSDLVDLCEIAVGYAVAGEELHDVGKGSLCGGKIFKLVEGTAEEEVSLGASVLKINRVQSVFRGGFWLVIVKRATCHGEVGEGVVGIEFEDFMAGGDAVFPETEVELGATK